MSKRNFIKAEFKLHEARAKSINTILKTHIKKKVLPGPTAIMLSAGADSHAVLFAALAVGIKPIVFSATLDTHESRDFICARNTAELFGLQFVPVFLNTDIAHLQEYIHSLYGDWNPGVALSKATVECLWPMVKIMEAADKHKCTSILSGFGGDTWYCTLRSQKKMYEAGAPYEAYLKRVEAQCVANDSNTSIKAGLLLRDAQHTMRLSWMQKYCKYLKRNVNPFFDKRLFTLLNSMKPIEEGWNPIQKAPWRLAFYDDFQRARGSVYTNKPMQKGDSLISEHFEKLLATSLNTKNYKNTIGIYNDQLRKFRSELD